MLIAEGFEPNGWQTVIGVLTALGAILAAVSSARAKRAETIANSGKLELEGMHTSVDSLQKSNSDLRLDNAQLRVDLAEERSAREALATELHALQNEFRAYKRECEAQRLALRQQIISMGGTPT